MRSLLLIFLELEGPCDMEQVLAYFWALAPASLFQLCGEQRIQQP